MSTLSPALALLLRPTVPPTLPLVLDIPHLPPSHATPPPFPLNLLRLALLGPSSLPPLPHALPRGDRHVPSSPRRETSLLLATHPHSHEVQSRTTFSPNSLPPLPHTLPRGDRHVPSSLWREASLLPTPHPHSYEKQNSGLQPFPQRMGLLVSQY